MKIGLNVARQPEVIIPSQDFYDFYTDEQIAGIADSLDLNREIPREYNYMAGGAANWDRWQRSLQGENGLNILNGTVELIDRSLEVIDRRTSDYEKVNVIDLGAGNAMPVKALLSRLLQRSVMGSYIATDISEPMLQLAEHNIKTWFRGEVPFTGAVRDMSCEPFDDLLEGQDDRTLNLVMLLGGTATNMRSFPNTIKVVRDSMGDDDLFVYTDKPDTPAARGYLSFGAQKGLSPSHQYLLDLMNIGKHLYEPEAGYDENSRMRYVRIRLNTNLDIKLETDGQERRIQLKEDETVQLLRIWHLTAWEVLTEFEQQGLTLQHYDTTNNQEYLLAISGIAPRES